MPVWSLRQLSIYPEAPVLGRRKGSREEKSFFIVYVHTQNEMKGDSS